MVVFVTLFLGLMAGHRPVEIAVGDSVAAIELYLDGGLAARLEGPPWTADVDFGPTLEPHRIEARAFDAAGRPLDEVHRLVNYSRSEYGAVIVLDPRPDGGSPDGVSRSGRVKWLAVLDRQPVRLEVKLDGRPLAVEPDGRFHLPPHDPGAGHVVSAVLTFEDGSAVPAEMAFGGVYGDRVTSALSAVPITSPRGRPWPVERVRGWLERDAEPLNAFTTRAELGMLLILRDERMRAELRFLRKRLARGRSPRRGSAPVQIPGYEATVIAPRPVAAHPGTFQLVRMTPSSLRYGLLPLLTSDRPLIDVEKRSVPRSAPQKLWDSLAVAGVNAAVTNRPRAVLLAVGSDPGDESLHTWQQARHYLESLRVPLFVWASTPEVLAGLGLEESERISSGLAGLERLADRVEVELESQTVVWLEGEHLPGEVTLSPAAPEGVELVR